MPKLDVKSSEGLRRACEEAETLMKEDSYAERLRARVALLREVRATPAEQRASVEFLERIWFDETLSEMGFGKVEQMSEVIAGEEFRNWFAKRVAVDLPAQENEGARVEALEEMRRELLDRAKSFVGYQPLLMVNRLLSALFPEDLIDLSYELELFGLLRAMGGSGSETHHMRANCWIRDRLGEVLGRPEETLEATVRRQYLPQLLWDRIEKSRDTGTNGSPPPPERETPTVRATPFGEVWTAFKARVEQENLIFERDDVESLHLGLWANERRHFAVLAGLSGTGKTRLAQHYGEALTGGGDRLLTVPVEPGWLDPTPLLGYRDPLVEGSYRQPEFLKFLLRASRDREAAHVCVLDEMNLSHPEQYLAPVLSAMEQPRGELHLHDNDGDLQGAPPRLAYPPNLVLLGTVNMDETTMGLSDKVLDRAFTVEFWEVNVTAWPGWDDCSLSSDGVAEVRTLLSDLMDALRPARLHFGWRVIAEVVRYLEARAREGGELDEHEALDRVIYAKVLPKLRGDDSPRLQEALRQCKHVLKERKLARSVEKVEALDQDREATGSFRFWR